MPRHKPAELGAELIARKGEAAPAERTAEREAPEGGQAIPRGTKDTVAVTVRLDHARYQRLMHYGLRSTPRQTNQEILVEALDVYLDQQE